MSVQFCEDGEHVSEVGRRSHDGPAISVLQENVSVIIRYDSNSGGEREIQRTMLELLNQLDGFDSRGDVKVIMATNRIETLDPALIRPGQSERLFAQLQEAAE